MLKVEASHEGALYWKVLHLIQCFGAMTGYWSCVQSAGTYSGVLLIGLAGRYWRSVRRAPDPLTVTMVEVLTGALIESVLEQLRRVWADQEVLRSLELSVGEKVSP